MKFYRRNQILKIAGRALLIGATPLWVAASCAAQPQKSNAIGAQLRLAQNVETDGAVTDGAKTLLLGKIKEAATFAESEYSVGSWHQLHRAMDPAQAVADSAESTPLQLQSALAAVQARVDALQLRPVSPDLSPRLALNASLFATRFGAPVNNVALMWASLDAADSYEVQRARANSDKFSAIYHGQGASFNDTDLPAGSYSYRLVARRDGKTSVSNLAQISTMALPDGIRDYSNQTGNGAAKIGEPLQVGDTFYRFPSERDGKSLKAMWSETSKDGREWQRGAVVMDSGSHPDLEDYKFEAENFFYDKKRDRIVMWAHWERSGPNYGAGRAIVASAKPGERFVVHHIYNPLGVQVRDMSVFVDDDGQGYLVAASNMRGQGANATLAIFKMNDDYTDVTGLVNKAMEGGYREAPHIVRADGFYYLFFSQAAGWFPSRAGYVTAPSLDGRWSEVKYLGNASTFSAQSGGIFDYGQNGRHVPVLMANRWIRGEGTSRNAIVPLHLANGFAFGDYAPTLLLDPTQSLIIPLQMGTLLSQNKAAMASVAGSKNHEADKAFDGDYSTFFQSDDKKWPWSVTSDLGKISQIRNVQISWFLHKGSEAYYKYTIEGSLDGQNWRVLLDRSDDKDTLVSKTYGFSSDMMPDVPLARYVRVNVLGAVLHNNPNNWYAPTLYEVKVYGEGR